VRQDPLENLGTGSASPLRWSLRVRDDDAEICDALSAVRGENNYPVISRKQI